MLAARVAARLLGGLSALLNLFASTLVLGLMVVVVVDVLSRNLLGAPLPGVPEIVALSIIVIVFLQAPEALARGRLVRSEGLVTALAACRPRTARALERVHDLAGAAVFAIVAIGTWPLLARAVERDEFVGAIGELAVPVWPVRLAVLVGSSLLTLRFLERACRRRSR